MLFLRLALVGLAAAAAVSLVACDYDNDGFFVNDFPSVDKRQLSLRRPSLYNPILIYHQSLQYP